MRVAAHGELDLRRPAAWNAASQSCASEHEAVLLASPAVSPARAAALGGVGFVPPWPFDVPQGDLVGVGGAGGAATLRGAGLVEAGSREFGGYWRWHPRGEREPGGVSAGAAGDAMVLEATA